MTTLLALAAVCLQVGPPPFDPPALNPPALRVEPRFAPFALPEGARIVRASDGLDGIAEAFAEDLRAATGRDLPVVSGAAGQGDLILSVGGTLVSDLGTDEGSAVEVYGDHLALMGAGPRGVARAAARALQLVEVTGDGGVVFPPLLVVDAPAAEWRGLALTIPDGAEGDAVGALIDDAIATAHRHGWNRIVLRNPWADGSPANELFVPMARLAMTGAPSAARSRGVAFVLEMSAEGEPPTRPLGDGLQSASPDVSVEVLLEARGRGASVVRRWVEALRAHGFTVTPALDATSLDAADALAGGARVVVGNGLTAREAARLERPVVNAGALSLLGGDAPAPTPEGWLLGALGGAAITRGDAQDAGLALDGSLVPYPDALAPGARGRALAALAGPAWTGGPWLTPPDVDDADVDDDAAPIRDR